MLTRCHARLRQSLEILLANGPSCEGVGACGSAEEAVKLIPVWKPDVVLMDIQLPNRSGVECTAALKELIPSLQVIILTAYEDTENLFKALRAGVCGYLLKRAQPAELSICVPTVKVHIRHICEKLHVRCRVDLFVKFGELKRPAPNP